MLISSVNPASNTEKSTAKWTADCDLHCLVHGLRGGGVAADLDDVLFVEGVQRLQGPLQLRHRLLQVALGVRLDGRGDLLLLLHLRRVPRHVHLDVLGPLLADHEVSHDGLGLDGRLLQQRLHLRQFDLRRAEPGGRGRGGGGAPMAPF